MHRALLPLLLAVPCRSQGTPELERYFDGAHGPRVVLAVPHSAYRPASYPSAPRVTMPVVRRSEATVLAGQLESAARSALDPSAGDWELVRLHEVLRALARASEEEKREAVRALRDPKAVFAAVALSREPHSYEAHLMLDRFYGLLRSSGTGVAGWVDSQGLLAHAGLFYLRADAYDRLAPYLRRQPAEARAVPFAVFFGVSSVRAHAPALQSLLDRVVRDSGAAAARSFAEGGLEALGRLPVERAQALALLLWQHRDRFGSLAARIEEEAAERLPSEVRALGPRPSLAPGAELAAAFHFADSRDYARARAYFVERGYESAGSREGGVALEKTVGERRVRLVWKAYESDAEGYLKGDELQRYVRRVRADLADPELDAVFVRAHAQFERSSFFRGADASGKLFFDGTCRALWDFARLAASCGGCALVGNVGGGSGEPNDAAGYELLEGLARDEGWEALRVRLEAALPSEHRRFAGPWLPPYPQALELLPAVP